MFQTLNVWALTMLTLLLSDHTSAQATINVRVISVQVLNNVDCDGFLSGDSDFAWEFLATDNTLGNSNNNPVLFGILGDFNYAYQNGNNGPYTMTAPGGGFSPSNGLYFSHDYVCPTDVPTNIVIDWRGYENDDLFFNYALGLGGSDGETANQTVNMAVPIAAGNNTQTFQATSTDAGCNQTYVITFRVERIPIVVNYFEDNICDAWQVNLNTTYTLGWCPSATLETNEPHTGDVTANGSVWVKFVAPASGNVEVTTDLSGTGFGTYFQIYHAVDGLTCAAGLQPITGVPIKDKFDYLSNHEFSDGIDFLGIDPEAEIILDACDPVAPFSYQKIHAGETYYVQITADAGSTRGYFEFRVNNLGGGSPPNSEDIPCDSPFTPYGTAAISSGAGSGASMTLNFGCAYDGGNNFGETGAPHSSPNPNQYHAYDYNHVAAGNGTMNESVWLNFVAPNSGRMIFETDYQSAVYSEDGALFGYDKRFSPGVPADYSCIDLENIAAQEGGINGLFGGGSESALINQQCLEPGYTYYGMVDPANNLTVFNAQNIKTWLYDPSVIDPINNPPGNDILCLTMANTLYEVPVTPAGTTPPFNAVAGSNVRGCREYLAGEPAIQVLQANRADQTVWHYFVVPPSGAIEMNIRAYIGMDTLRYAMYNLLNGTDCYGGLNPATFTLDGTQITPIVTPILEGSAGFTGNQESVCCMTPGSIIAIQLDGGSPGDEGQYIIEYIREVESYSGDTYVELANTTQVTLNSTDTAFVCFGDDLTPGNLLDGNGDPTLDIPSCLTPGFVMHSTIPVPVPVMGSGFTYIDTLQGLNGVFTNNTNGSGAFGNPLFNTVYYVSSMADDPAAWGDFLCSSSTVDNTVQVVYLQPVVPVSNYDNTLCEFTFTATGGMSAFNGSLFSYTITDPTMTVVQSGTFAAGVNITYAVPSAAIYTITVDDGSCPYSFQVDASACGNPCILNPNINYVAANLCNGQSIFLEGANQTTAGVYTDVFTAANGCDSTIYTTVSILEPVNVSNAVTICTGSSYTVGGNTYSTAGQYVDIFTAANGCDSIVTTNLFVESQISTNLTQTICTGTTYPFAGNNLNVSGVYVDTLVAGAGCDSIVTLNLTVVPLITNSITSTICEGTSVTFGTQTLSASGTYTEMLTTGAGCDSLVTMYLFVSPTIQNSISAVICEGQSYTLGAQTLSTTGTYSEMFTTATGCDSLVQLFLTISNSLESTYGDSICEGESYTFGTQTLTTSGVYTENFPNAQGCDSLVTLELEVLDCEALLQISNICTPNNDGSNDTWRVSDLNQIVGCTVRIFNRWGELMYETNSYQNDWSGTKDGEILPDGVYYYAIGCEDNREYQGAINLMRFKK